MKKSVILVFASVLVLSAIGMTHKVGTANAALNLSQYYVSNNDVEKKETNDKVQLYEGSIVLTADKKTSKELPNSTVISNINVTNGNKKYSVELSESPENITSISESSNNKFLAIQASYSNGYKLIVLNLNDGNYKVINEIIKNKKTVESVPVYSWSPNGKKLAFSYGDTSKSRIAIYNLSYNTFTYIPRQINIISTAQILWDKKSTKLDYISEYPSDKYKLYSYSFNTKKVKVISSLDNVEVSNLSKLNN